MIYSRTLGILEDLVAFPSVSRDSNQLITQYVLQFLQKLNLTTELLTYRDQQGIEKQNVLATSGSGLGGLVYCAHTDVVPADQWTYPHSPAFQLHTDRNRVYGRGSCDMKGSLACFLTVLEATDLASLRTPVSILCTADEEVGYDGARYVSEHSGIYRQLCQEQPLTLIGEPTSLQVIHAHKGIYVFRATSHGKAGHSSTNDGCNANWAMIPFLQEMKAIYEETFHQPEWRDERFQPSEISWNLGINDFTYATNITPERSVCTVSFRPMPNQNPQILIDRAHQTAENLGLEFELLCGARSVYVEASAPHIQQMNQLAGVSHSQTVSYGTDAAMFTELQNIVICGPGDIAQAHTVDEWIAVEQLERGVDLYQKAVLHFCG